MTVTVQDVMRQMRNYFIASTLTGTFTVADGIIDLDPPLAPGAWVAIEGSGSLDGVHQLDENGKLPDAADEFRGHGGIGLAVVAHHGVHHLVGRRPQSKGFFGQCHLRFAPR